MADFECQGLARRRRGAGTFWLGVGQPVAPEAPPSFTHYLRRAGATPGPILIGYETRRVAAAERGYLRLPANSMVWKIQRIFTVDRVPVGFATSILPAHDLTGLPAELESYGSLFDTLHRRYHLDPVRAWKRRRPTSAPRFVTEALGTPAPVHLEESLNHAADGTPIEYARTYMRDDDLSAEALIERAHGRRPHGRQARRR